MSEPMVMDCVDEVKMEVSDRSSGPVKKTMKRKRASLVMDSPEVKAAKIEALKEEMKGLLGYYREVLDKKVVEVENMKGFGLNSVIACMLRKRMFYGIPNADADVLEDEFESALSGYSEDSLTCRKIHERITAVSEKEEKRLEKEEFQTEKQMMREQEEIEKDRRQGKEEAEVKRSHLTSQYCLKSSTGPKGKVHWGIRRKPKTDLVKEIKLTASRGVIRRRRIIQRKQKMDGLELTSNTRLCNAVEVNTIPCFQKGLLRRQLLQFDKCHRPAFYGVWPKKSQVVGGRHPFRMDPDLDYEVDSDEEWEEDGNGAAAGKPAKTLTRTA
ncbi:hypothetical protein HAX54_037068 [Datura stramonium]|uniref:Chromatin assembly factor 1 subunit A dimerization domain-containing protein n=1 Tax=Datura stramonium TaxID=4076 RepID=A0ABS8SGR2_DATST|nr:hypothetical protein [Datura stramonium]